jgi:tetrahydromethanopterin S-methyltransferase subunit B
MKLDASNQVVARIDDEERPRPRRTLDLGNIHTPELGLLSPQRTEIAPKGAGRDAALVAYSERLRNSYKTNEGGLRDGMLKLGEAFRNGETIAVSCFCRAGEACHADVVKIAIEKIGHAMKVREVVAEKSKQSVNEQTAIFRTNPRTERAWFITTRILNIPYQVQIGASIMMILGVTLLVTAVGLCASRSIVHHKPAAFLREHAEV